MRATVPAPLSLSSTASGRSMWVAGLVAGLAALSLVEAFLAPLHGLVVAAGLLVPVCLLWRRRHPAAALAVALALSTGARLGLGDEASTVGIDLALLGLTYALARWGSAREIVVGVALIGLAVAAQIGVAWGAGAGDITGFSVLDGLGRWLLPLGAGYVVRSRAETDRLRLLDARRSERVAIARELHDTLAHHVTAIAVQAQAARVVAPTHPEMTREALVAIEESASRALADMRGAVGVLREDPAAPRAPQRGVGDLAALATADGGVETDTVRVEVDLDADVGPLPPALDMGVYRIAQEAVTNARRHARRAQTVRVRLARDGEAVLLTVADDGDSGRATPPGFGLVGMRERAELLGGTLTAGPGPGGGWRVVARLPHRAR